MVSLIERNWHALVVNMRYRSNCLLSKRMDVNVVNLMEPINKMFIMYWNGRMKNRTSDRSVHVLSMRPKNLDRHGLQVMSLIERNWYALVVNMRDVIHSSLLKGANMYSMNLMKPIDKMFILRRNGCLHYCVAKRSVHVLSMCTQICQRQRLQVMPLIERNWHALIVHMLDIRNCPRLLLEWTDMHLVNLMKPIN